MESFLSQIAHKLYEKYGDEISSLNIIFPSRRARLFFADALSQVIEKPLWQPIFVSIDEVMEEIAGIRSGDRIRLITELYKVYSCYHNESFDSFYFWGEMLLSDFDSIDKYLLDADMLFANISDIKKLENDFGYLTDEQREVIARFWGSFGEAGTYSEEQERFMDIWTTLPDIYHSFRKEIADKGVAYTGMVYRMAAEKIKNNMVPQTPVKRYVIAGFNALSECEKILFAYLSKMHDVEFFWDYDRYYLDNPEQEAGLFMRENLNHFHQRTELPYSYNNFSKNKNITVVSAPSDSLQCKYIAEFLSEIETTTGRKPDKDTAIVLTDENLLIPALYSIPENIDKINVTMGYPLKLTLAYSFVERLIGLQMRKKMRNGKTLFYHDDARGLLEHPYVIERDNEATFLSAGIVAKQQIYTDLSALSTPLLADIFRSAGDSWDKLGGYLKEIISQVAVSPKSEDEDISERKQRIEFFSIITENIDKLHNSLEGCGIELSVKIFASLLRRVLQSVRMPYQGEPLQGIQVMGILETRNLDFENVLILSVNDDTFPGNRTSSPSFIPYNLRLAYGLPTPHHHEGVYAYYFYRLLQRAGSVHLAYSARSDEKSTGEQSRYIYQLEYESPHVITRREMAVSVNIALQKPITVEKKGEVNSTLSLFFEENGRKLSPTSFFNYIQCPLKFYFHSVARFKTEKDISKEVDTPMFGTILHAAMESLYQPLVGINTPQIRIQNMIGTHEVEFAVDSAIKNEYFKGSDILPGDHAGNLLLAKEIVVKYINRCVLPFDAAQRDLIICEVEKKISSKFIFRKDDSKANSLCFEGISDRVDRLSDGMMRIVDYKTGARNLEFKGVSALFSQNPADQNAAALQTFLYGMMFNRSTGKDIQPALYYVRYMNSSDYSPLLVDKNRGGQVVSYLQYKEEFESALEAKLTELFDKDTPFVQCTDSKPCQWCDFNAICKR